MFIVACFCEEYLFWCWGSVVVLDCYWELIECNDKRRKFSEQNFPIHYPLTNLIFETDSKMTFSWLLLSAQLFQMMAKKCFYQHWGGGAKTSHISSQLKVFLCFIRTRNLLQNPLNCFWKISRLVVHNIVPSLSIDWSW